MSMDSFEAEKKLLRIKNPHMAFGDHKMMLIEIADHFLKIRGVRTHNPPTQPIINQ